MREQEESLRTIVAARAEEFGAHVNPQDLNIQFMENDAAPGCRIFHARWGAGETEGALSGLIRDGEPPDTYPGQAMAKIFQRWSEAKLPDAKHAAIVAAYLFDATDRHEVILSDDDRSKLDDRTSWQPHVRLPEVIDVAGRPGIAFWWVGPNGASEMRIHLGEDGRTHTSEKFMREFID